MADTVVIGMGNPLMSDEGIGIHLLHQLREREAEFPGVELLDLGTSGMEVLGAVAGRKKAVLMDCAFMGDPPGRIRRFGLDEVRSVKALSGFSAHEGDLLTILELSRQLGECPEEVVVFGIQPERVAPGEALSEELQNRAGEYIEAVVRELRADENA